MSYSKDYLKQTALIAEMIDYACMDRIARALAKLRNRKGRLFVIGVGGSAANCSHAVNDFRKLTGIEAYTPADNVAELTARTNDEGWPTVFEAWLITSRAGAKDAIMVFSVGGGDAQRNVSVNIVRALELAREKKMKIFGVVGRDGGYTKKVGDEVIVIPTVDENRITPHAEAFQAVIWHGLVTHPELMIQTNKWEGFAKEITRDKNESGGFSGQRRRRQ